MDNLARKYRREIEKEALILRDLNLELEALKFRKVRHINHIVQLRNSLLKLEGSNAQKILDSLPVTA